MPRRLSVLVVVLLSAAALASGEPSAAPDRGRPGPIRQRRLILGGARAFLGVTTLDVTPDLRAFYGAPKEEGVLVAGVAAGSPAAAAGVKVGDVITRVDGHAVGSPWELAGELGDRKKGDRVTLDVVRDRTARKIEATLEERDEPEMGLAEEMAGEGWRGPTALRLPRIEKMEEIFQRPEWKARLDNVDECERVRKRLEAVEERLRDLERRLPPR